MNFMLKASPYQFVFPFPTPKVEFEVIPSMKVHKNSGKSNRLPSSAQQSKPIGIYDAVYYQYKQNTTI